MNACIREILLYDNIKFENYTNPTTNLLKDRLIFSSKIPNSTIELHNVTACIRETLHHSNIRFNINTNNFCECLGGHKLLTYSKIA